MPGWVIMTSTDKLSDRWKTPSAPSVNDVSGCGK